MTPLEIKIELMRKGVSQKSIAEANDWFPEEVSMCINDARAYPQIRKAIAKILGRSVTTVFGTFATQPVPRARRAQAA